MMYPLLLKPPVKDYLWSGTKLKTDFGFIKLIDVKQYSTLMNATLEPNKKLYACLYKENIELIEKSVKAYSEIYAAIDNGKIKSHRLL